MASFLILAWTICSVVLRFAPIAEGKCAPVGFSCDETCANIMYCQSASAELAPLACPEKKFCLISNGMPSCDGKVCEKITCTAPGLIPSPSKCENYYMCDKSGSKTPTLQTCPTGSKFDTRTKTCTTDSGCRPKKCAAAGEQGDLINFCYTCTAANDFIIYECPAPTIAPTASPTVSPVTCTTANQKLADPANCRSFYICEQTTTGLVAKNQPCRTGMIFDATRRSCVTGTC